MILYFSGTGNSTYVAKLTAELIGDEDVDLFEKIRNKDYSPMHSDKPWVVAAPIYCWQLPHVVRDWMMKTELSGSKEIYFLMTCGSSVGNAEKYMKKLCEAKGLAFKGCAEIVMPENYIAMFEAPYKDTAERIIDVAERSVKKAAGYIKEGKNIPGKAPGVKDKLLSSIVNMVYYPLIVKDKKFYADNSCTGCGICEARCPLGNIEISDGKPKWRGDCTHCMACIAYCPEEAIEYGKASEGKERYICPR